MHQLQVRNATQRCLNLPELVGLIAEACMSGAANSTNAYNSHNYINGSGTVLSLAKTCRTIFQACLPTLWHTQMGLEQLVSCLPADKLRTDALEYDVSAMYPYGRRYLLEIVTEPNGRDWDRFDMYARHVRVLVIPSLGINRRHVLHDAVIPLLSGIGGGRPLLPTLRQLHWAQRSFKYVWALPFLTPLITSLSLNAGSLNEVQALLTNLHHHCRGLRELFLDGLKLQELDATWCLSLANELHLLPNLRVLKGIYLEDVSHKLLQCAAYTPSLISLELLAYGFSRPPQALSLGALIFPSLKSLTLLSTRLDTPTDWNAVLEPFLFPSLQSIDLSGTVQPAMLSNLLTKLPQYLSPTSLTELKIDEFPAHKIMEWAGDIAPSQSYANIQPLKAFKNLTKMSLSFVGGIRWTDPDNEFCDFLGSFPHLRVLNIQGDAWPFQLHDPDIPFESPTLTVLAHIARRCPKLSELQLNVDADTDTYPLVYRPHRNSLRHWNLVTLDLRSSPVGEDYDGIADYIYDLFPRVKAVRCLGTSREPHVMGWKEVSRRLEQYALDDAAWEQGV